MNIKERLMCQVVFVRTTLSTIGLTMYVTLVTIIFKENIRELLFKICIARKCGPRHYNYT